MCRRLRTCAGRNGQDLVEKRGVGQWNSLEAYCMTATRNTCVDRMRRQKIHQVQETGPARSAATDKDPYEKMMGKEIGQRIRKCMNALPENQRMIIQLREIEGLAIMR